jgi:hypothetical protein
LSRGSAGSHVRENEDGTGREGDRRGVRLAGGDQGRASGVKIVNELSQKLGGKGDGKEPAKLAK